MKKVLASFVVILSLLSLFGCSSSSKEVSANTSEMMSMANPFDQMETTVVAELSHGPRNPTIDEDGSLVPLKFTGDEIQYEYYVNASGQAKNVGFLLYLNGIPQPYKIDVSAATYEYMHTFDLENDNEELPFTFIFTPITGQQKENLNLVIASIYNPGFMPDMDKTTSYGGYQTLLSADYEMYFETDAPPFSDLQTTQSYGNIEVSDEPVTDKFLETLSINTFRDIDRETFNEEVFTLVYFDGQIINDHLQVNKTGTIQIQYILCGYPGLEYETTFYLNHCPMSSNQGIAHSITTEKGVLSTITFEVDLEQLEDFNTFYVVSVPTNSMDYPDKAFEITKIPSILLYK